MSEGVLEAPPPRFTADEVAVIAAALFGLEGGATDLGSERDQTFLIDDGAAGGVLKISNLGEEAAVLELEIEGILHIKRIDPELPVAAPRLSLSDEYWPTWDGPDGPHFVRLFERLNGRHGGPELDERALFAYGRTHARLNLALCSYFHAAAGRKLLWDVRNAADLRQHVETIPDASRRRLVENVLDRFDERVAPRWPLLRAQVCHGDLNLDNVLLDGEGRISGIADFGDINFTAQAADFAIGLASLLRGRPAEDVFRAGRIATDGYQSRLPLEPPELELLGDLVAARLAAIVTISAWRVERYPENAEYIQNWDDDSWALLEQFDALGYDQVARELGAPRPLAPAPQLARRRNAVLGPALTELTYDDPVHVVRAEGVWLYTADGRRLLDAYNNVPVVGHCHPRVTEAVVRQTRLVNTHARYLYEPLIELGERLVATMPEGSGLDTVMLVNSGSEANELAWRFARAATGGQAAIVTEHAYHGVTTAIADLSPEEWPAGYRPVNVETIAPPGTGGTSLQAALERLLVPLAATFLDGAFTSDGIRFPPPEEVASIVDRTHAAGGLFVADEVQAGHGRTGDHLWSFEHYGITPDLVTLGKPMGNGYPVAAVITRREIAEALAATARVFSTFGGNPVAAQAALAVLDVIEDERLVEQAARVGSRLANELAQLDAEVRGRGLLAGVELASSEQAERVVNELREKGILIGRTGRDDNVLKIRPPLVFADEHADALVTALAGSVSPT
ncbi:MAG: aminotransferase class III-fold pyridoxal phosphate-dependent enzyme [Actinobacteria bacterium]|nr:MAG: aminotransferase class III-fold pyridoxal phosphate-dependent enzyme [Actinomycetota bacterium]